MPLVERLMGLNADGSVPSNGNPDRPKIPVHDFFAAGHELVAGNLTVAQIRSALAMDPSEETEFDALVATAPTGTSALATANKAHFVNRVHAVFILAEGGYAGYNTPAAVRSKLSLPTP